MATKQNILFLCMMGRDRSRKAVSLVNELFSNYFEAKCAGVLDSADTLLTPQAIDWADVIVCMEESHKTRLLERFPEAKEKKIEVWHISPSYSFDDKELEDLLRSNIESIKNNP